MKNDHLLLTQGRREIQICYHIFAFPLCNSRFRGKGLAKDTTICFSVCVFWKSLPTCGTSVFSIVKKADSWRNCPKRLLLFNIGALRPRLKNNSYFQRKCSGLSISADGMLILLNTFFSMRCHCCTYFSLPVHCSKLKKVSWCGIVDFFCGIFISLYYFWVHLIVNSIFFKKTSWEKRFHVRHLSEIYFTAVDVGEGRGFSAGIPHIIAVFLKSTRMRHSWRASDPVQGGMNRLPQVVTGSQIQEEKMITK